MEEEENTGRVARWQLYYKRLIGDNLFGTQKLVLRTNVSKTSVAIFILYFCIALTVIFGRAAVPMQFSVNNAIRSALEKTPYETNPRSTFADLQTVSDAGKWLSGVLPTLLIGVPCEEGCQSRSLPFSIQQFNRILPAVYAPDESAKIRLTVRQMKQLQPEPVLPSFDTFVDRVWAGWALEGPPGEYDNTATMTSGYEYVENGPVKTAEGSTYQANDDVPIEWRYAGADAGYAQNGGYVADIVVAPTADQLKTIKEGSVESARRVFLQQRTYLHAPGDAKAEVDFMFKQRKLANPGTAPVPSGEQHSVSAVLSLLNPTRSRDAATAAPTSSWVVEMMAYNANFQSLSYIQVVLVWNAAGTLLKRELLVDTVQVSIAPDWFLETLELVYFVMTLKDAAVWLWRLYRSGPKAHLASGWNVFDALSTMCSIMSYVFWGDYTLQVRGLETRLAGSFPDEVEVVNMITKFKNYGRVSSFATLSIALRIIKFLAASSSRVALLQHTLFLAAKPMCLYLLYIFILFFGFMNVAQTNFAYISSDFTGLYSTLIACFHMFFGKIDPIKSVGGSSMASFFFIAFMMFFYFISVQMFNSIINYAYNTSREEMEPQFEREKMEAKARAILASQRPSAIARCMMAIMPKRKRYRPGQKQLPKKGGGDEQVTMDPKVREKVEEFKRLQKEQRSGDSPLSIFAFFSFAFMYVLFLFLGVRVATNYEMRARVNNAVTSATVALPRVDGQGLARLDQTHFFELRNMDEMDWWITKALPDVFFAAAGAEMPEERNSYFPGINDTIIPYDNLCLSGWNCAITQNENLMRITTRRTAMVANNNTAGSRFVKYRMPTDFPDSSSASAVLSPANARQLWPEGSAVPCTWKKYGAVTEGAAGGFNHLGGFECVLVGEKDTFLQIMERWRTSYAISLETQTIVVEFLVYNGNVNMLAHTLIDLSFMPTGTLKQKITTVAFELKDYKTWGERLTLIPLCWYAIMVLYYLSVEVKEIKVEHVKRAATVPDDAPFVVRLHVWAQVLGKHFVDDPYNILDVLSIFISFFSVILFINFTSQVWNDAFDKHYADDTFPEFLSSMSSLCSDNRLYVQLSSLNILVIFLRFIKLFRENPRMNKLTATLNAAARDIVWFVVMLFVTLLGFMTFAFTSFGPKLEKVSTAVKALQYCFEMIIGVFDYGELHQIDPIMAPFFFFLYIIVFNCIFVNIFFAIIDCFFVTSTPPPLNMKKFIKSMPVISKLPGLRNIQWDDSIEMEKAPGEAATKEGPPARTEAAKITRKKIVDLRMAAAEKYGFKIQEKVCKLITHEDLGGPDPQLGEVVAWGREQARYFIDRFVLYREQKASFPSEKSFIDKKKRELNKLQHEEDVKLKETERHMRYHLMIEEPAATADLDTALRYMVLLEHQIARKSVKLERLRKETEYLSGSVQRLQFTEEEMEERARGDHLREEAAVRRDEGREEEPGLALAEAEGREEAADGPTSREAPYLQQSAPDDLLPTKQSEIREKQRSDFISAVGTLS